MSQYQISTRYNSVIELGIGIEHQLLVNKIYRQLLQMQFHVFILTTYAIKLIRNLADINNNKAVEIELV